MSNSWRRNRTATLLAVTLAVVTTSCDSPVAPASLEGPPRVLEFAMASYGGRSVIAQLTGDEITVVHSAWDGGVADTVRAVPTTEAWRAFWDAADEAGIHRWRSRYVAEGFMDGTGWGLRIESRGLGVKVTGSNAYPDSQGNAQNGDFTDAFNRFLGALEELTGYCFLLE